MGLTKPAPSIYQKDIIIGDVSICSNTSKVLYTNNIKCISNESNIYYNVYVFVISITHSYIMLLYIYIHLYIISNLRSFPGNSQCFRSVPGPRSEASLDPKQPLLLEDCSMWFPCEIMGSMACSGISLFESKRGPFISDVIAKATRIAAVLECYMAPILGNVQLNRFV